MTEWKKYTTFPKEPGIYGFWKERWDEPIAATVDERGHVSLPGDELYYDEQDFTGESGFDLGDGWWCGPIVLPGRPQ